MNAVLQFRAKIQSLIAQWQAEGQPSRDVLQAEARELQRWRQAAGIQGLWTHPPLMVTATVDDAMGLGLEVIRWFAEAVGLRVVSAGLLQTPEAIAAVCAAQHADLLGMSVLQFDSEDDLAAISRRLPETTFFTAGGPVFKSDPDLARRAGIGLVAKDAGAFLSFLLELPEA